MTVQEFYDWCKYHKCEDAELEISLKFAGLDMKGVKVTEWNIDYLKVKKPHKDERKVVRLG
jgi:hypothetical protein